MGPSYGKTLLLHAETRNENTMRTVSLKRWNATLSMRVNSNNEKRTVSTMKLQSINKKHIEQTHYVLFTTLSWPKQKDKTLRSLQWLIFCILFLPFNYRAKMSSIFINAPSSSSSMKHTYPPSCNKPSIEELKHGNCNPTRNKWTHPFVLRSSSPSFRLGCRCRHRGSLHSRVLFCLTFHTLWSIVV